MKKLATLGIAAVLAAGSMTAFADEDAAALRQELDQAHAEIAALKAKLAAGETTVDQLPAAIFVPENMQKLKIDQEDDGSEIEVKGDIENGNVQELAQQAKKALVDAGYTVVKESIDKDDEAKLVYEKKTGEIKETVEVEIDKSWLSDKVEYDVEYEKH